MKVAVFGASGNIGTLVVEQLLKDGHSVTVFVHKSSPFTASEQLSIVAGDIHNDEQVKAALDGADAVVSTLSSWHSANKDILSSAMKAVIPAMQSTGIKRIITLTGSDARAHGDNNTVFRKLLHRLFSLIAKGVMHDAEVHLQLLNDSNLDWTSVRSPVMRNGEASSYALNSKPPLPWQSVTRATVARAIVDQLGSGEHIGSAPHLHTAK